jgi:hypothetical protein
MCAHGRKKNFKTEREMAIIVAIYRGNAVLCLYAATLGAAVPLLQIYSTL